MKLFIDFIIVTAIAVIVMCLLFLFKRGKNEIHHNIHKIIFIILLIALLGSYGVFHEIRILQYFSILTSGTTFLLGPLVYLYFKSIISNRSRFIVKHKKHFLPFLGYFIVVTIPVLISVANKAYIYSYLVFLNENHLIVDLLEILFTMFYLLMALKLFYKIDTHLRDKFSSIEYRNFRWLQLLVYGLITCLTIQLFILLFKGTIGSSGYIDLAQVSTYVFLIFYLGFYGIQQPGIEADFSSSDSKVNTIQSKRKYISEEENKNINLQIHSLFSNSHPYLDNDLTLNKLAKQLGTTDKKLSYYLNNHLKTNFYDFINGHRVEAFIKKIDSDLIEHLSLLGIAYECGFKSKSSFNRIFKKHTGLSPSAYIKDHKRLNK